MFSFCEQLNWEKLFVFYNFINSFILIYVLCIWKRCLYFSSLSIVCYFLSEIMVMMVQLVSNHSCFSVIFARIKTCKLLTYEVYLMFIFMSMFYDQNAECHAILVVFMHLKLLPESEHDGYLSSLWWVFFFWQDLNWCLVFVRAMFSQNFISFVSDSADSHTYITYS